MVLGVRLRKERTLRRGLRDTSTRVLSIALPVSLLHFLPLLNAVLSRAAGIIPSENQTAGRRTHTGLPHGLRWSLLSQSLKKHCYLCPSLETWRHNQIGRMRLLKCLVMGITDLSINQEPRLDSSIHWPGYCKSRTPSYIWDILLGDELCNWLSYYIKAECRVFGHPDRFLHGARN